MVELPAEERGDFLHFQQALVRLYAAMEPTSGFHWIIVELCPEIIISLIISRTCTSYLVG